MDRCVVTFLPDGKKVVVEKGATVLSAAVSAHIHLNSGCGGDGVCGRCKVVIRKGTVNAQPSGRLSAQERKDSVHLACQTLVQSDIEVEVPAESRLDLGALSQEELALRLRGVYSKAEEILEAKPALGDGLFGHVPLVSKVYLELSAPDFNDKLSDLERVVRGLQERFPDASFVTGLANVRRLGALLRSSGWKVTVGVSRKGPFFEVVSVEPGDTQARNFGMAFDIGTTTITGQLVDLNAKKILGSKAAYNRQATFGSDVISRIIYAQAQDGLEKLHHAVVDTMNEMIEALAEESQVDLNDIGCLSVAGNTTMIHLLFRVDPTSIRQAPYVPVLNFAPVVKASEVGIKISPRGLLFCAPGVSSYVGGDITAGVLACDIQRSDDLCLLIDIGTNGEIALGNAQWIISCAASAGPAFEGSGMSAGMRAARGAIQSATVVPQTFDVRTQTIGGDKPRGICGSGYIDLLNGLLEAGILDKNGRFNTSVKSRRLRQGLACWEFLVVAAEESATGEDIVLTEADVDNLKRAKAAIYSGISILVRHMGLTFEAVRKIFIAGGFGTSLNIDSAVKIGLIPDLPRDKYVFVGNSSLAGARQILLSGPAAQAADRVAENITYFELSTDAGYMDEYMAALFFPHTDAGKFPSVAYGKK